MTALAGLAAYLNLRQVAGLGESVRRHLGVNQGRQGWTDAQMVVSLALLNLSGGECVEDLRLLEKDEGLGRVLRLAETTGSAAGSAGRWKAGGARNAAVACRRPRRCSGT